MLAHTRDAVLATDEQGRLERRQPVSTTQATERLAAGTGVDVATCRSHLEALLLAGYRTTNPQTGFPLFAFRLHQFISRGDTVYASLEPRTEEPDRGRILAMEGQVFAPGDRSRRLYPLVFCRECGQHYCVVDRPATGPLQPRDLGALSDDQQVPSGFILPDPEERYTVDDTDILPEDWVELRKDGTPAVRRLQPAVAAAARLCDVGWRLQ